MSGTWKDLTDNVNVMASNLTGQVRNIAEVTTAVANGDLYAEDHRRRARRDARAEEHDQHDGRSALVVRRRGHARGARGRHRGQARRPGRGRGRRRHVAGPHRQRERLMAVNLTTQVRNIAEVTTAVANGDLSQKITVDVARRDPRAEEHDQHDGRPAVARSPTRSRAWRARWAPKEARRPGARSRASSGTWKDLTDNVNQLAGEPHDAGARDRRRRDRGDQGRPDAADHRRGAGRARRAQGQHQPDDRQPARDDASATRSRTG